MAGSRVRECVNAAVDALKVDTALLAIVGTGKVAVHITQGTPPPYAMVRGGTEVPWAITLDDAFDDDGDNGGRQIDVLVDLVSTYRGSSEVDSMADRVMEVLTDQSIWSGISGFQLAEFVRNDAPPPQALAADGTLWFTRFVTMRVTVA
jgi:3-deoxy-D-arabino-heptulosonate 7-phosphate (DAHP) synthase